MKVTVNGRDTVFEGGTVASLVLSLGFDMTRIAVELNGDVVRRADLDSTEIKDGDKVEVVHFVGGG